jgi:hypothetical protein
MLTEIDLHSLTYICLNLREVDRVEIYNMMEHDNPLQLAHEAHWLFTNKGRSRMGWHKGRPCAVIALTEDRPGVWHISMFGTDEFKAAAFECMRWARNNIPDMIHNHGGRRLQCDSHIDHHEAHKFLRTLGARVEGEPMKCYGKDGSTYLRFVWIEGENGFVKASRDGQAKAVAQLT